MIVRGDDASQRGPDRSAVILRQDGVQSRALSVAGDKNGNIVLMKARMSGRSAAFARLARQIGAPALKGFEDERFVRLDDSASSVGACRPREPSKTGDASETPSSDARRNAGRPWPSSFLRSSPRRGRPTSFLCRCAIGVLVSALKVRLNSCSETAKVHASVPKRRSLAPRSAGSPGFPPAHGRSFPKRPDGDKGDRGDCVAASLDMAGVAFEVLMETGVRVRRVCVCWPRNWSAPNASPIPRSSRPSRVRASVVSRAFLTDIEVRRRGGVSPP